VLNSVTHRFIGSVYSSQLAAPGRGVSSSSPITALLSYISIPSANHMNQSSQKHKLRAQPTLAMTSHFFCSMQSWAWHWLPWAPIYSSIKGVQEYQACIAAISIKCIIYVTGSSSIIGGLITCITASTYIPQSTPFCPKVLKGSSHAFLTENTLTSPAMFFVIYLIVSVPCCTMQQIFCKCHLPTSLLLSNNKLFVKVSNSISCIMLLSSTLKIS
jgi:hypothetical protein